MYRVLVSDAIAPRGVQVLEDAPGIEAVVRTSWSPGELEAGIRGCHGLIVRSTTQVTAGVIAAADALRVIGRAGIGVDNVDLAAASRKGIVVMNAPAGNAVTTAEHAVAMMMALARRIPQATASMKAGRWEKKRFEGVELCEKTLGLVGAGNIGSLVAARARGLGMRVLACDPYLPAARAAQLGVRLVGLDELLAAADVVSLHVPRTAETARLLRAETFAKMKPGVRIVNCSRGGIVDEADLLAAIRAGIVAGAALDVFEHEPLDPASPLLAEEEVILTPHLGASTREAQEKVAADIAHQVVDLLTRGVVRNAVNVPAIDPETLARIAPFLDLAGRIGGFLGRSLEGRMEELRVEYRGEVAGLDTRPLTAALLVGLLRPALRDEVNAVNATVVARERALRVVETSSPESQDYRSLVAATLVTDAGERSLEGTLFARRDPRIVRIDGYELELVPAGHLLVFANDDRPGVIGKVGSLLGEGGVNIGGMQLGRRAGAHGALAVLSLDGPVPAAVLDAVRALPVIRHARQLELEPGAAHAQGD